MTKLVWDNAALVSHQTMLKLGLIDGQIVNLKRGNFIVEIPVLMQPGHADDSVTVLLGYGREQCGRVGAGVGFNGFPLRTTAAYNIATDLTLEKTDKREMMVSTQTQDSMDTRHPIIEASLAEFAREARISLKNSRRSRRPSACIRRWCGTRAISGACRSI